MSERESGMPERGMWIGAWPTPPRGRTWEATEYCRHDATEYVRSDLYAAQESELKARNAELVAARQPRSFSIEEEYDCHGEQVCLYSANKQSVWAWAFNDEQLGIETFHVGYPTKDAAEAAAWDWRREQLSDIGEPE